MGNAARAGAAAKAALDPHRGTLPKAPTPTVGQLKKKQGDGPAAAVPADPESAAAPIAAKNAGAAAKGPFDRHRPIPKAATAAAGQLKKKAGEGASAAVALIPDSAAAL